MHMLLLTECEVKPQKLADLLQEKRRYRRMTLPHFLHPTAANRSRSLSWHSTIRALEPTGAGRSAEVLTLLE